MSKCICPPPRATLTDEGTYQFGCKIVVPDCPVCDAWQAKAAYKRWAAVLDEEARPLTEVELEARSPNFRLAYAQAMAEDPRRRHCHKHSCLSHSQCRARTEACSCDECAELLQPGVYHPLDDESCEHEALALAADEDRVDAELLARGFVTPDEIEDLRHSCVGAPR